MIENKKEERYLYELRDYSQIIATTQAQTLNEAVELLNVKIIESWYGAAIVRVDRTGQYFAITWKPL